MSVQREIFLWSICPYNFWQSVWSLICSGFLKATSESSLSAKSLLVENRWYDRIHWSLIEVSCKIRVTLIDYVGGFIQIIFMIVWILVKERHRSPRLTVVLRLKIRGHLPVKIHAIHIDILIFGFIFSCDNSLSYTFFSLLYPLQVLPSHPIFVWWGLEEASPSHWYST